MQTVWKGTISFGLVSIPVKLVSATQEKDISFRQVRVSDGSRVRYRRVAESDGEEVAYADIAKGYELPDGGMVVLTDDDMASLPVASSKAVDVLQFVDAGEIDPAAYSRAYYALPTGDAKPYVLLRDALASSGRVAVVKMAMRSRERLALLRPAGDALVVQTMLWPDEVRSAELPAEVAEVEPRRAGDGHGGLVHRRHERGVVAAGLHRRVPRGDRGARGVQGRGPRDRDAAGG